MKLSEIKNNKGIRPLKHPLAENPHLVIEPNYTCNSTCKSCYNINKTHIKTLDQIKQEIDIGLQKRNLETISILGGEPTLHPGLLEIIKYIKSKGLICQLLTNGIKFLEKNGLLFLGKIIKSGVDRVILHVDPGQGLATENQKKTIETLFDELERQGVFFSLSITVYRENTQSIPNLIKKYARYKYFDGILALLERDSMKIDAKLPDNNAIKLFPEYKSILDKLGLTPVTYIPTSLSDNEISWLMYFFYINSYTGKTYRISPTINRWFRRIYRVAKNKQAFGVVPNPKFFIPTFIISMVAEFIINPFNIGRMYRLAKNSGFLNKLRFHYIVIQSGPEFSVKHNAVQLCYHCPDATIRNGKITPVCVADRISPMEAGKPSYFSVVLHNTVYQHLEEI